MRRLLPPEGRGPFAHIKPRLIDTDLVGKRGLKRFLPVFLKRLQPVFGAAAGVSDPAKAVGKELSDIPDPVVVQPIDHTLDHGAGLVGLAHIGVARQHGLLGS
jgi:hypothetical protein